MKYYNYLNLQQKLCRVRRKIPALIRKRYSEEVDYDFTKIDDIYKFLTPALNKYGVNFEVYEETPTRVDENGHPIYLYQENGFWMYESDLRIGWVNADNPDDREEAVIHLVGTHEMAEKAKGTAWTYALKYYLFSKFNINQDGNDADSHDFREESEKPGSDKKPGKEKQASGPTKGEKQEKQVARAGNGARRMPEDLVADSVKQQVAARQAEEKEASANLEKPQKKTEPAAKENSEKKEQKPEAEATGESASVEGQMSFMEGLLENGGEAKQEERNAALEDGFQPIMDEETPFDESPEEQDEAFSDDETEEKDDDFFQSLMDDMEDEAQEETSGGAMTVEAARKVICIAGAFAEQPLGDVLDAGERGRKTLEWLVNRYSGPDKVQKEAAGVLLNELNCTGIEKQAA